MTAALKERNFELAEKKGESSAGPWKVKVTKWEKSGSYEQTDVELYHYGHLLAELGISEFGTDVSNKEFSGFKFHPRPGYGLSQSDVDGIWIMLGYYSEDNARDDVRGYIEEVQKARRENEGGRHPYSGEIQQRYRWGAKTQEDAYPFSNSGESRY